MASLGILPRLPALAVEREVWLLTRPSSLRLVSPLCPSSDQSSRESCPPWGPQLHHTCPSCSRSSTRRPLACGLGGQRRLEFVLWRPWARGPAESDRAPRGRTPVRGLNKQGPRCRGAGPGPGAESAACSSVGNPSLPETPNVRFRPHQPRCARSDFQEPISKSGDRQPTERKCYVFSEVPF